MKTLILIAVVALLTPLVGQEAKIMIVEKTDSQRLSRAYERYKQAKAEWEEAKSSVAKLYTTEKGKTIEGWEKVQFSADFRAIVPESSQYAGGSVWSGRNCWLTGVTSTSSVPLSYSNGTTTLDASVDPDLVVKEKR